MKTDLFETQFNELKNRIHQLVCSDNYDHTHQQKLTHLLKPVHEPVIIWNDEDETHFTDDILSRSW